MSRTLTLPDGLFDRLRRTAHQQGLEVEELLAQWVEGVPTDSARGAEWTEDDELLAACTRALVKGSAPPVAADWDDLMATLRSSEPVYPTVEEAMSVLRHRHWVKDE